MKTHVRETILGVDYGRRNIGLAFGINGFVQPLSTISGKSDTTAISEITRLARENRVKTIVVGLPLTAEGKETFSSKEVRKFAKLLKIFSKIRVDFANEYGSTISSREEAITQGLSGKKRRKTDNLSAALILKNYYSEKGW